MNTFLPYPNFEISARCLDDARLRKQRIEAIQIFNTISNKSGGWKNHPAVKQWIGYEGALSLYAWHIANECVARGFIGGVPFAVDIYAKSPSWVGNENFHASHRSKLLWKGRVDAVCYSLRAHLKVRSINEWLKINNFNQKNVLTREEVMKLESLAISQGVKIQGNYYKQFNWKEKDDLSYVWPTKNET